MTCAVVNSSKKTTTKTIMSFVILISCIIQSHSRQLLSTEFATSWTNAGSMGSIQRSNFFPATFSYNNKIYALGSFDYPKSLWVFDIDSTTTNPFTDSGTNVLSVDIKGSGAQFYTQTNSKGYILGSSSTNPIDLYVYDLQTNNIQTLVIPIDTSGSKACLTHSTDRLYVVGGTDPTDVNIQLKTLQIYDITNSIWVYDPNDSTNPPPIMNKEREDLSCAVVHDYLYAIGGYSYYDDYNFGSHISSIEKIQITNIFSQSWAYTSYELLKKIKNSVAITYGDYIFVIGGKVGIDNVATTEAVEIINTIDEVVTYGGALSYDTYGAGVIMVNNIIYAFGGLDNQGYDIYNWQHVKIQTSSPTADPTENPTPAPTNDPTLSPTNNPTSGPTVPSESPSVSPTEDTNAPTKIPSVSPTMPTAPTTTDEPTHSPLDLESESILNNSINALMVLILLIVFGL